MKVSKILSIVGLLCSFVGMALSQVGSEKEQEDMIERKIEEKLAK